MIEINIFIDPLLFLQFIRESTGGIFDSFFVTCSNMGGTGTMIILLALLYWCIDKKLGQYLLVSLGAADLVNGFVKITACIYRPWILDSRIHPVKEAFAKATGYSFPSGHATTATTVFAGSVLRGNFSKYFNIVLIFCLVLIGFSRIYVGVHSILDVFFGFLLTLIIVIIFSKLFDKVEEKPNLDIIISVIGIIFAVALTIYATTKSYPLDYDAAGKLIVDPTKMALDSISDAGFATGFFIGWPIERRFIRFVNDGDMESKMMRAICGFLCLELILRVILPSLGGNIGRFTGDILLSLFVILLYPAIIKFFQNRKNSPDK